LVSHREAPLHPTHASQFREECFPEKLEGFTRVATVIVDSAPAHRAEQMILVIYASPTYLRQREKSAVQINEQQKWDSYYASLPMLEIDEPMRMFGEELAERIHELLPPDSEVLEAGCGAGWQSLVLAKAGKLRPTLMDFSPEALNYAKRSFKEHNLSAKFECQDVFAAGEPQYDMVFNAGVLEHYAFDEQVAFLRGMASRSKKYVLALVPNRRCYWYWLWRLQRSSGGQWPFGKEMPMANLSEAFESAGLQFLGHWHGGTQWSEFFIKDLAGIDDQLREEILAVHRSPIIPDRERAYLVAALGCKGEAPSVAPCWSQNPGAGEFTLDQLTASIADSLAAFVGSEHRCKQLESESDEKERQWNQKLSEAQQIHESLLEELQQQSDEIARLCGELADKEHHSRAAEELAMLKKSRGYRLLHQLWRTRLFFAPHGSRRARFGRTGWNALRSVGNARSILPTARTRQAARRYADRIFSRLAPRGTFRARCVRKATRGVRRLGFWVDSAPGLDLEQVLSETQNRRGIVIYPPFIDWSWMRQRPHQLMTQFAKAGYLSLFCSPRARSDSFRGFMRIAERLYLCDTLEPLYNLPNAILLVGWTGHEETVARFRDPLVIYDYLDNLGVSSEGGVPDRHKLELHHKLVTKSAVVLATARQLFDEVKPLRPDALYCPNGADYEHFHLTAPSQVPSDIADLVAAGRPIVGYYGALARWFDYKLVAHAADARKDCEFLLIGPDFDGTLSASKITRLPNVHWLGEKKYEDLPVYLNHFSVATIPFLLNDITEATSPVKLFEYMAGGKPIVATDMPECRKYPGVLVARDPAEYVAMLDDAMERSTLESYRQLLDREALGNTWKTRTTQIIDRLDALGLQERRRSA